MPDLNWMSPTAYDLTQNAEMTGIAWECLRRDPEFEQDCRDTPIRSSAASQEFRSKWGLVFRS